jgi:hypothetical protein
MGPEELRTAIQMIQNDPEQMKLLGILSERLSTLINTGTCDLKSLLATLVNEGLISQNEYEELMVETCTVSQLTLSKRGEPKLTLT